MVDLELSEWAGKAKQDIIEAVKAGLIASGCELRNTGRQALKANEPGYELTSMEKGITLGKMTDRAGQFTIKVHGLGGTSNPKGHEAKARLFIGAKGLPRMTKAGHYRGMVQAVQALDGLENEALVEEKIRSFINRIK